MKLSLALAITTLAMAYLGIHLAISPPVSRRAKWFYRIAFLVCGAASLVLIGVQARKTDKDQQRAEATQEVTQKEVKEGVSDVKTLLLQPNPDKGAILARLDKLSENVSQPLVIISLPPSQTAYSKLTNQELKKAVSDFVAPLKLFANKYRVAEEKESEAIDKSRHAFVDAQSRAKTDDERKKIAEWYSDEMDQILSKTHGPFEAEYQRDFRPQAINLRDEMLSRLPPPPKEQRTVVYEGLYGPWPIEDIISDLERLSSLLP